MAVILAKTLGEILVRRHEVSRKEVKFFHRSTSSQKSHVHRWQGWTYDQMIETASLLHDALTAVGIRKGDRVSIWSGPRLEANLCDLAILGNQAWNVPLFPNARISDVAYILEHAEPSVIFLENSIQARALLSLDSSKLRSLKKIVVYDFDSDFGDLIGKSALFVSFEDFKSQAVRYPIAEYKQHLLDAQPNDPVTLCYTQGSSGTPKGVLLSHDNWVSSIEGCIKVSQGILEPQKEIVVSCLAYANTLGRLESWLVQVMDWTQFFCEHPEKLMTNLMEVQPTLLFLPPRDVDTLYRYLLKSIKNLSSFRQRAINQIPTLLAQWIFPYIKKRTGGKLRYIVSSGGALHPQIARDFAQWGIYLFEGYGLTETTGPIALNTPQHCQYESVGRPMPDTEIKTRFDGEILVRSRKNFIGYYKDPETTKNAFSKDGWLSTGDLGYFDPKGFLHIVARKKDFFVGLKESGIEPQKIETLAKLEPYIEELVVHTGENQAVVALVTLKREEIIQYAISSHLFYSSYAELTQHRKIYALVQKSIEHLNEKLSPFETIHRFIILSEEFSIERGELTPSFRPRRQMIEKHYSHELQHLHSLPSTPLD